MTKKCPSPLLMANQLPTGDFRSFSISLLAAIQRKMVAAMQQDLSLLFVSSQEEKSKLRLEGPLVHFQVLIKYFRPVSEKQDYKGRCIVSSGTLHLSQTQKTWAQILCNLIELNMSQIFFLIKFSENIIPRNGFLKKKSILRSSKLCNRMWVKKAVKFSGNYETFVCSCTSVSENDFVLSIKPSNEEIQLEKIKLRVQLLQRNFIQ